MEYTDASELLASVLKDMNEIIDATGVDCHDKSATFKLCDSEHKNLNGNLDHISEEGFNKNESSGELLNGEEVSSLLDVKITKTADLPPRAYNDESIQSPSNSKRLLPKTRPGFMAFSNSPVVNRLDVSVQSRSTSLGPESVPNLDTDNESTDNLQARLIMLQKQVNAQAHRIAELEQRRRHTIGMGTRLILSKQPLNTVLGNVASLEKLDLLAEVSKQQVQIANLENAKRELEMQVERLSRRLARLPTGIQTESEVRMPGSGLEVIRRAITPEPDAIKLNGNMENRAHIPEEQATRGYLNAVRLADQFALHESSSLHLSPLLLRKNLAASRSHMLPSGASQVNFNPISGNGFTGPLGVLHPNETLRYPTISFLGTNGQYKSASLNELRHHRTTPWDGQYNQNTVLHRVPRPIDWTQPVRSGGGGGGSMRLGLSPVDSTYNQVYAPSPPLHAPHPNPSMLHQSTGPHEGLPPQYASDYHRQAFLTNRTRSPPSNSARDEIDPVDRQSANDNPPRRWCATEINPLSSSPCLFDPTTMPPTTSTVNGLQSDPSDRCSPNAQRNTAAMGARCEPRSFATPPVGRRMLPSSPTRNTFVNGNVVNQNNPVFSEANSSVVNSRFKRILASTPLIPPYTPVTYNTKSTSVLLYANKDANQRKPLDQHPLPEPRKETVGPTNHSPSSQMQPEQSDRNETGHSSSPLDPGHGKDNPSTATAFRIPERRWPVTSNGGVFVRPVPADYGLGQQTGNMSREGNGFSNASPNSQIQPVNSSSEKSGRNSKTDSMVDTQSSTPPSPDVGYTARSSHPPRQRRRPFRFAYPTRDFVHWDKDMVSAWLYQLGLGYSVPYARRWLQQGSNLVHASRKEIEQEMCIRNALHLKKLYLHLQLRTKEPISVYSNYPLLRVQYPVDFNMAAWLDDLGLTSYIAAFEAAAIDLLVLNHLTTADLVSLKMTNELHFLSLRRGLQMLRRMNYDLSQIFRGPEDAEDANWSYSSNRARVDRLFRQSSLKVTSPNGDVTSEVESNGPLPSVMTNSVIAPAGDGHSDTTSPSPSVGGKQRNSLVRARQFPLHVCYWSQYRVMAWLHQIELPEYAPELCGSGVHGALMVLEDRFTPELLASILHIPPGKTLVRRHLANKFAELVGERIWERKQQVIETPDVPPLTAHSKNKSSRKRSLFSTNRRRKSSHLDDEFVCPVDIDAQHPELFAEESPQTDTARVTPTDSTSIQSLKLRETDL